MTKFEKKQIESILQDEKFQAVLKFYLEVVDSWKDSRVKMDNEFETIWNLAYTTGKIDGLKSFFEQLDNKTNEL